MFVERSSDPGAGRAATRRPAAPGAGGPGPAPSRPPAAAATTGPRPRAARASRPAAAPTAAPTGVRVPQIAGVEIDHARHRAERVGLTLAVSGYVGKYGNGRYNVRCVKVLRQSPVAGERLAKGSAGLRDPQGVPDAEDRAGAARRDHVSDDDARTANLLGAIAYALTERTDAALRRDAAVAGTDAMALDRPGQLRRRRAARDAARRARALAAGHGPPRRPPRRARPGHARGGAARPPRPGGAADRRRAGRGRRRRPGRPREPSPATRSPRSGRPTAGAWRSCSSACWPGRRPTAPSARRICRLCDGDVCGHPDRCPVTQAVPA